MQSSSNSVAILTSFFFVLLNYIVYTLNICVTHSHLLCETHLWHAGIPVYSDWTGIVMVDFADCLEHIGCLQHKEPLGWACFGRCRKVCNRKIDVRPGAARIADGFLCIGNMYFVFKYFLCK